MCVCVRYLRIFARLHLNKLNINNAYCSRIIVQLNNGTTEQRNNGPLGEQSPEESGQKTEHACVHVHYSSPERFLFQAGDLFLVSFIRLRVVTMVTVISHVGHHVRLGDRSRDVIPL